MARSEGGRSDRDAGFAEELSLCKDLTTLKLSPRDDAVRNKSLGGKWGSQGRLSNKSIEVVVSDMNKSKTNNSNTAKKAKNAVDNNTKKASSHRTMNDCGTKPTTLMSREKSAQNMKIAIPEDVGALPSAISLSSPTMLTQQSPLLTPELHAPPLVGVPPLDKDDDKDKEIHLK